MYVLWLFSKNATFFFICQTLPELVLYQSFSHVYIVNRQWNFKISHFSKTFLFLSFFFVFSWSHSHTHTLCNFLLRMYPLLPLVSSFVYTIQWKLLDEQLLYNLSIHKLEKLISVWFFFKEAIYVLIYNSILKVSLDLFWNLARNASCTLHLHFAIW